MKDWKKLWLDELDSMTPSLRDDILSEKIPEAEKKRDGSFEKTPKRRPLIYVFSSLAAVACLLLISVVVILSGRNPNPPTDEFVFCAITLEINPKVTFVTGEDGKTVSALALNSDADLILSDKERYDSLIGKSCSEAARIFVDYAARAGYIELDSPDAVRLSATGDFAPEWLSDSAAAVSDYFKAESIPALVISEVLGEGDFAERFGLGTIEDKDALSEWAKSASLLFLDRDTGELSEDEADEEYKRTVLDGIVRSELTELIEGYAEDVAKLYGLSLEIIGCSLSDYFEIKADGLSPFAPNKDKALLLVSEMDGLISDFEEKYGQRIESHADLSEASGAIVTMLSEFLELWSESAEAALGMLSERGVRVDGELLLMVESRPTDRESLGVATRAAYERRFRSMTEKTREKYEAERESVDYSELFDSVVKEHGSLEEFFESKNDRNGKGKK